MMKKIFIYTIILALAIANYGLFLLFSANSNLSLSYPRNSFADISFPLEKTKVTFLDSGPLPKDSIKIISQGSFISQKENLDQKIVFLVSVNEKNYLHFNDNFVHGKNQILKIFLINENLEIEKQKIEIGEIENETGKQNYEIPNSINPDEYNLIIIQENEKEEIAAQAVLKK